MPLPSRSPPPAGLAKGMRLFVATRSVRVVLGPSMTMTLPLREGMGRGMAIETAAPIAAAPARGRPGPGLERSVRLALGVVVVATIRALFVGRKVAAIVTGLASAIEAPESIVLVVFVPEREKHAGHQNILVFALDCAQGVVERRLCLVDRLLRAKCLRA